MGPLVMGPLVEPPVDPLAELALALPDVLRDVLLDVLPPEVPAPEVPAPDVVPYGALWSFCMSPPLVIYWWGAAPWDRWSGRA